MEITFGKVKKALAIMLAVCFLVSVTAGAASAGMFDRFKDPSISKKQATIAAVAVGNGGRGGDGGYATGGKVVISPYNSASNDADFDASNDADVEQSNKLPVTTVAKNSIKASNSIFNLANANAKAKALKADDAEIEDVEADSEAEVEDAELENDIEDVEAENEVYVYDNELENDNEINQNAEIYDNEVDQTANADQTVTVEDVYAYGGEADGGDGGDGGDENYVNVNVGAAQGKDNEVENELED